MVSLEVIRDKVRDKEEDKGVMARFYKTNRIGDAYTTLVDSDITLQDEDERAGSNGPPPPATVPTQQETTTSSNIPQVVGLIVVLALITTVATLANQVYMLQEQIKNIDGHSSNAETSEQLKAPTSCDFTISAPPPSDITTGDAYFLHHLTKQSCVEACMTLKSYDSSITTVTTFSDAGRRGCWCRRNVTTIEVPEEESCFLRNETLWFIERRPYRCDFQRGDGRGGTEVKIGEQTGDQCIDACVHLKQVDPSVNGVTVFTDTSKRGCWCERQMRWVDDDTSVKTCALLPHTTHITKGVDTTVCELTKGYGVGGEDFLFERQTAGECVDDCLHMKRADPLINGMSINTNNGKCRCHRRMKKIGPKYWTCMFQRNTTCVANNTVYDGDTIVNITVSPTWQQCSDFCYRTLRCSHWTWDGNENVCHLKANKTGVQERESWVSGGRGCGRVACSFTDGEGVGGTKLWVSHHTGDKCAQLCLRLKSTNPLINGATIFGERAHRGCFCRRNMTNVTAGTHTQKACFLKPKELEKITRSNRTLPDCHLKPGDGTGSEGSDIYLGALDEAGCMKSCLYLKDIDNSVNGMSVYADKTKPGCWCERNMKANQITWAWWSYLRKSCVFLYNTTNSDANVNDNNNNNNNNNNNTGSLRTGVCSFSPGRGYGDVRAGWVRSASIGRLGRDECYVRCYHERKRRDWSINGVTWDRKTRECYCERNMVGIGEYHACLLVQA